MRIVVVTCEAYQDALKPFLALLSIFWPDCPYAIKTVIAREKETWCSTVARAAKDSDEPILLFQEDFFLNVPVQQHLIERGLELLGSQHAGCVRLYPMPGANFDLGDPHFGLIALNTRFRISCQAAIWNPAYLYDVAMHSMWTTGEASDFENLGSPYSDNLPQPVLAFKRESRPWPLEYLCSGITAGRWNPDSKRLFERHGLTVDYSQRPMSRV